MIAQTPGKIFLAEERGLAESAQFRRLSTFSFGGFAHPHKGPLGRLFGLNEETLAGGHTLEFAVAEAAQVLVLPITGAVSLSGFGAADTLAEAGETLLLTLPSWQHAAGAQPLQWRAGELSARLAAGGG